METLTKVANNIKFYRYRNNWTQEELSNQLNVSRSNISKWESGDMTPSLVDLLHISELFNITLDQLVGVNSVSKEYLYSFYQQYTSDTNTPTALPDVIDYLIQNPIVVEALKELSTQKPADRRKLENVLVHFIKTLSN